MTKIFEFELFFSEILNMYGFYNIDKKIQNISLYKSRVYQERNYTMVGGQGHFHQLIF